MSLQQGERGSSLVLVIVLVFMIGLIASATLSFAGTSIRASSAYGERADVLYDVDGALQAAANQIRNSDYIATKLRAGALDPCAVLTFPGPSGARPPGARDVRVTCEPRQGTGATDDAIDRAPDYSLLATQLGAPSGEVGIWHQGTSPLRVLGALHSQSSITTDPGPIQVDDGNATAVTGCTEGVYSDATNCRAAAETEPMVVQQPTSAFTPRNVPECPEDDHEGGTVRFQPGFYDNAAELNELMSDCPESTFWFPGAAGGATYYYFDFHDGEPGFPEGDPVWTIGSPDVRVVGGGTTDPGRPGTDPVTIPGSCTSPLQRSDNAGVQFVFGGRSRLRITAGQMELCGPGNAADGAPPVAIFGGHTAIPPSETQQAGPDEAPSGDEPGILKMAVGGGSDDPSGCKPASKIACFENKERIREWENTDKNDKDGFASTGAFPPKASDKGWLGIVYATGYVPGQATPPSVIPPGAKLRYAKLYVRHREQRQGGANKDPVRYIQVEVRPSRPGAPLVGPANPENESTPGLTSSYGHDTRSNCEEMKNEEKEEPWCTDTVDLLATMEDEVTAHGLAGVTVKWTVAPKTDRRLSADVDSIQIAVGWTTTTDFRSQQTLIQGANCVGAPTAPYPQAGSCPLVQTEEGPSKFYVQGTGYAPRAAFDLRQTGAQAPVFSSGLIARAGYLGISPDPSYAGPLIMTPRRLSVLLRAYTCPDGGCDADANVTQLPEPWQLKGTARVEYRDEYRDPQPQIRAGHRGVTVTSWSLDPTGS